jgi:hypothetical protein
VAFHANHPNRAVKLLYRQADQSQSWRSVEMQAKDNKFRATVPGEYTQSPYPILYIFEVREPGGSTIFPGFGPDLSNQPYILVRSKAVKGQKDLKSQASLLKLGIRVSPRTVGKYLKERGPQRQPCFEKSPSIYFLPVQKELSGGRRCGGRSDSFGPWQLPSHFCSR